MRLINVHTYGLEEFFGAEVPPYAILSHTWGLESEEILFQNMGNLPSSEHLPTKLIGCCQQAKQDNLSYAWIDTCCIDKSNSVEIGETINSMFRYYRRSTVCYAYLSDVSAADASSEISTSRWFKRGWTLQELIAPRVLKFFSLQWKMLGCKNSLSNVIQQITNIPRPVLEDWADVRNMSIAQRMSWAAGRETKRPEDIAYCLLGIFDVNMPMIYGEGVRAFSRLQEEIMKHSDDSSLFAWGISQDPEDSASLRAHDLQVRGLLAGSPNDFINSGRVISRDPIHGHTGSFAASNGRLQITVPLESVEGQTYALLYCGVGLDRKNIIGIPVNHIGRNVSLAHDTEYYRPGAVSARHFNANKSSMTQKYRISIELGAKIRIGVRSSRRRWFYLDLGPRSSFRVVDVHPRGAWLAEDSMISTSSAGHESCELYFALLRNGDAEFLLTLEYSNEPLPQSRCCIHSIRPGTFREAVDTMRQYPLDDAASLEAGVGRLSTVQLHPVEDFVAGIPVFAIWLPRTRHDLEHVSETQPLLYRPSRSRARSDDGDTTMLFMGLFFLWGAATMFLSLYMIGGMKGRH